MSVRALEMKPLISVAAVLKLATAPLKIPAWSVAVLLILAGAYGYVSGRQNPVHHYVPYVGYPLVLDTTTGKACYSSAPKPTDESSAGFGADPGTPAGPVIPMCAK
jgi:hypothetical protein